jgi:hypothetical protein
MRRAFVFPSGVEFEFGEIVVLKGQRFRVESFRTVGDEARAVTLEAAGDLICEWCVRPLTASRSDARYCSNACRQAAYRQR